MFKINCCIIPILHCMQSAFYRYVEYKYVNKKREHSISSIRKNPFIEIILKNAYFGSRISDLASLIIDDESEREEANIFINELIENQILVSNLEVAVTGSSEVERTLAILNNCNTIKNETDILQDVTSKIKSFSKPEDLNKTNASYIQNKLKELEVDFDKKYLLQTDLYLQTISNTLSKSTVTKLIKAIHFLGSIQELAVNYNLENFKKAFQKRYESKEMPLSIVLDTELGIGFLQNAQQNDSNPILDSFSISKSKPSENSEFWSDKDYILEKKLQSCILKNEHSIILTEKDFKIVNSKKRKYPATFSAMIEVLKNGEDEVVMLDSIGNTSALKLIGRFCNGSKPIEDLAKQLIEKEESVDTNVIYAEVAHIPESRTGNILRRPVLRTYEIPYLSNSILSRENQIEINDLMVSINQDKIILRSKKHNKEVLPFLSNAHNYANNALPIYQFLCELQSQNNEPVQRFDWGILKNHYNYLPRVVYNDVILVKARWLILDDELIPIAIFEDFELWRKNKKLPKFVNIVSGDNTILLDLEKEVCFKLLKKSIKSKIVLEEFLFSENSIVKNKFENHFVNQFIIPFYRTN